MSASEIVSTDPMTGEVLWRGPAARAAEVDATVAAARAGFRAWRHLPLDDRIAVARGFAARVAERREEFARLIARETGKPYWEALTEADTVRAKVEISITAQAERAGRRESEAAGVRAVLRHRPHGVLAVVGPYNFPAHLPNGHIVPALLAGNAVIFKPSEKTPATGLLMAEFWAEAGLPHGVLSALIGDGETGRLLVAHDGIDGVLFTGGVTAGHAIHRALADAPHKILALELGGNAPLVIAEPVDHQAAAHLIVQSAYISAGQRCSCTRRLIVPTGAFGDAIIDALLALIDRIRVDGPFADPAPYMGALVDNAAADAILAAQARMIELGARPLRPVRRLADDKPLLSPGLLDVTDQSEREDREFFGPLLQLIRVAGFDAALAEANATSFGLSAGLIGGSDADYARFQDEIRAGVVNWNRPTTGAASSAPFGGVGVSGNHRPSAYYAADYCAYPVASLEADTASFRIETGLSQ